MARGWLVLVGLVLALLAACAPRLVLEPKVPLPQVGVGKGQDIAPQWVLPGNPMPLADDFEAYPLGAVLTTVAPKQYGLIAKEDAKFAIAKALNPQNAVTKAVRLAWFGGALSFGCLWTPRGQGLGVPPWHGRGGAHQAPGGAAPGGGVKARAEGGWEATRGRQALAPI